MRGKTPTAHPSSLAQNCHWPWAGGVLPWSHALVGPTYHEHKEACGWFSYHHSVTLTLNIYSNDEHGEVGVHFSCPVFLKQRATVFKHWEGVCVPCVTVTMVTEAALKAREHLHGKSPHIKEDTLMNLWNASSGASCIMKYLSPGVLSFHFFFLCSNS